MEKLQKTNALELGYLARTTDEPSAVAKIHENPTRPTELHDFAPAGVHRNAKSITLKCNFTVSWFQLARGKTKGDAQVDRA